MYIKDDSYPKIEEKLKAQNLGWSVVNYKNFIAKKAQEYIKNFHFFKCRIWCMLLILQTLQICVKKRHYFKAVAIDTSYAWQWGGHQNISCSRLQCLFCAYWHDTYNIQYQTSGYSYKIPRNIIIQPYTIHNKIEAYKKRYTIHIKKKNTKTNYEIRETQRQKVDQYPKTTFLKFNLIPSNAKRQNFCVRREPQSTLIIKLTHTVFTLRARCPSTERREKG